MASTPIDNSAFLPTASVGPQEPKRSFLFRFFQKHRHALNDWMAGFSRIPNSPVMDPRAFEWTAELSRHADVIREEAMAIYRHRDAIPPLKELSPDHHGIATDDSWRSFFLIGYGQRIAENIARAPRTTALVERIPGLNSAFFSILAPGAVIPRHRGVTKAFITAHLGLKVPRDAANCTMEVDDQRVQWCEGEWVVFDDTYEHEVWNNTGETRIILLCQVARPLRMPGSWLARAIMAYVRASPFVRDATRNLVGWEEAFKRAEGNVPVAGRGQACGQG